MGERTDQIEVEVRESHRSSEDVRDEIERTRRAMSATIDELHYRTSPEYLKRQMKEGGRGLMGRIKGNPAAAAIAGLGLYMMFRDRGGDGGPTAAAAWRTEAGESRGGRAREALHSTGERAGEAAHAARERVEEARDTASRAMHRVSDRANELRTRSRIQARHARDEFWRSFGDNPLAIGAVGIALGALLGAAVPESEREDSLMGDAAERVRSRARDEARHRAEQAREVARAATGAARQAARQEASEQGLTDSAPERRI